MQNCYQLENESVHDFVEHIKRMFRNMYGYKDSYSFFKFRRGVQKNWIRKGMLPHLSNLAYIEDDFTWEELVDAVQDAEWLYYLLNPKPFQPPVHYYNDGDFKVNEDGFAIVYTDGCCFRNGQPGAQAGIGVWFGNSHQLNVAMPLDPDEPQTNNVAEIRAVLRAIKIAHENNAYRLVIKTDSKYLINSLTKWIKKWLSNGWKKADGQEVKHRYLYRQYLQATQDMTIAFEYVRAHKNEHGNIMADMLAKKGAYMK